MIIKNRPVLALFFAAFIISFSGIFVKVSGVTPTASAFYRVFFGTLFLLTACVIRKEFKKRSLKNNILASFCGCLFALELFTWHMSIKYIGPGLATVLGNFQVFVLSLTGFLVYKEKVTLKFIISVPLAIAGLFLVIGVDAIELTSDYQKGVAFGLFTALLYGVFLLLLRKVQSDKDDFSLFYYLMILSFSCAFSLGISMIFSNQSFGIPSISSFASLVALGFLVQALAWVIISNSLPKVRASHAGLILLLQPALSFVWDVLFFGRPTGSAGWAGLVIVLAAIYMGMTGSEKKAQ